MNYQEFKEGLDGLKDLMKDPEVMEALVPLPDELPQRDLEAPGFKNSHEFAPLNSLEDSDEQETQEPARKRARRPKPKPNVEMQAPQEEEYAPTQQDYESYRKMQMLQEAYGEEREIRNAKEQENARLRQELEEARQQNMEKTLNLLDQYEYGLQARLIDAENNQDIATRIESEKKLGTLRARRELLLHEQARVEAQEPEYVEENFNQERPVFDTPPFVAQKHAFDRFVQRNPWYMNNPGLRAMADQLGNQLSSELAQNGASHDIKTDQFYATVERSLQAQLSQQQPQQNYNQQHMQGGYEEPYQQQEEYSMDGFRYSPPTPGTPTRSAPVGNHQHYIRNDARQRPQYNDEEFLKSAQFARFRNSNLSTKINENTWVSGVDALREGLKHKDRIKFRPDGRGINIY